MAAFSELAVLKGGVSVLLPALKLALDLEDRGFHLRALPDGYLEVRPHQKLTPADCQAIREFKPELLRIIQYETEVA